METKESNGTGIPAAVPPQSGMDRQIKKNKWPPKKIALVGVGGLVIIILFYNAIFGDSSSRLNVEAERLTISIVERGPFQEFIPVTGSVLPIETFFLDAIEGGRIERIFLEAGSMVKKGDPILRLANTNLQLDVMYREALTYDQINNAQNRRLAIEQNSISVQTSLADVEYQLRLAKMTFERDSALAVKNLISPEEFKRTKDNHDYWRKRMVLAAENWRQDSILRVNQLKQLESFGTFVEDSPLGDIVARAPDPQLAAAGMPRVAETQLQEVHEPTTNRRDFQNHCIRPQSFETNSRTI